MARKKREPGQRYFKLYHEGIHLPSGAVNCYSVLTLEELHPGKGWFAREEWPNGEYATEGRYVAVAELAFCYATEQEAQEAMATG